MQLQAATWLLAGPLAAAQTGSEIWDGVLRNSCPFEPDVTAYTPDEIGKISMWVGHEYHLPSLRERNFDDTDVTAFSSHPWSEAVACGAMVQHAQLSDACKAAIRLHDDGLTANCYDWLSFGGTRFQTKSFATIRQDTPSFGYVPYTSRSFLRAQFTLLALHLRGFPARIY